MEFVHRPVVVHVHSDLLVRLAVQNRERGPDLDFVIMACTEECANHTILRVGATEVVIKNREKGDGVDCDIGRRASRYR